MNAVCQRTIESEQTTVVEAAEEITTGACPLLLNFLEPADIAPPGAWATGTWSTGPDDGTDYLDI